MPYAIDFLLSLVTTANHFLCALCGASYTLQLNASSSKHATYAAEFLSTKAASWQEVIYGNVQWKTIQTQWHWATSWWCDEGRSEINWKTTEESIGYWWLTSRWSGPGVLVINSYIWDHFQHGTYNLTLEHFIYFTHEMTSLENKLQLN